MQRNTSSLSPGVGVSEIDLTTVVPAVATSTGAFAGPFIWGPGEEINTISSENKLVEIFGTPSVNIASSWFSAANFLQYASNLKVVRALGSNSYNAVLASSGLQVKNATDYNANYSDGVSTTYGAFSAKYPGDLGNSLGISICINGNTYSQNVTSTQGIKTSTAILPSNTTVKTSATSTDYITPGDLVALTDGTTISDYVEVSSVTSDTITVINQFNATLGINASILRKWKYANAFTDAPTTSDYATARNGKYDEMHLVVLDSKGLFTGVKGAILEKFGFISKASDAKTPEGNSNYYKNVINTRSKYLWWLSKPAFGTYWEQPALDKVFAETIYTNSYQTFSGGSDGLVTVGNIESAYDLYANPESSDISILISGDAGSVLNNYLISLVESRKDAILCVSPLKSDVVDNINGELNSTLLTRAGLSSSSYTVMDSGWKYQYDKYNDVYHWIPLNGDVAGLIARTDQERDPWFSPGGGSRGLIKNVVKLSWNPSKTDRDELYMKGINPVVTFPGEGTMLYGDKTLLSRPSAFDRINVRRLFIVLEKSIAKAARSTLFEFNDQFTRAQFVSLVEPYLRDVKGRRGITDFRVVCDETNNTAEVIDRNEFIGDIYIKPARSINYITLNFVAVRTGVNFSEIVGQF